MRGMNAKALRRLSALLCACLLLALAPAPASTARADEEEKQGRMIMVSLGDSYSSGEGIEPFIGAYKPMKERQDDFNWLAHRSENAWSGMLRLPGVSGTMADHWDANWYFVASSGATTENIKRTGSAVVDPKTGRREGQQQKDYDRDWVSGTRFLPGQLDVFYETPGLDRFDVDYVTMSIGGNDVDFVGILTKAATKTILSTELYDYIDEKLDHFYDKGGVYYDLKAAYRRVAEAAPNAAILIAGYPELLDYEGKGALFNRYEAYYINGAVRIFNLRIQTLINELREEGMNIHFVSVESAFRGHQAYSDGNYLNPLYFGPGLKDQDLTSWGITSAYSMHPNYDGARAYAECVQKKIDELEAEKDAARRQRQVSGVRDVVLVLDGSGSMAGDPINQTRKAAKKFIDTVLAQDAGIGIVTYSDYADMKADFSMNGDYLKDTVDELWADSMTNTYAGLAEADRMLGEVEADKRIVVLMSDGLANEGRTGQELADFAQEMRSRGIIIYTLGFFSDLYGSERQEAQASMEQIANEGRHYEVEDADDLVFFFGDIADEIVGGRYVYIRIACPVDVEVTYNGETLSSVTGATRASFGTLTFEQGEGDAVNSSDDRTKVLRLRDGADYQIDIRGNGEGTMNYTAGFVDTDGNYSDLRRIEAVPITADTRIEANAARDRATVLKVDTDGDGKFDQTYSEGGPEKQGLSAMAIIGIVLGGLALLALAALALKRFGRGAAHRADAPGKARRTGASARGKKAGSAPSLNRRQWSVPAEAKDPSDRAGTAVGEKMPESAVPSDAKRASDRAETTAREWTPEGARRFCGKCGAPVKPGATFCGACGSRLGGKGK